MRNLVRDTLRREGYKVLDAPNAAEARRIAAAYKGPIHLLIADVVMPKEGGRDLATSLVSRRPAIKVLFMSGYTDQAVVDSGLVSRQVRVYPEAVYAFGPVEQGARVTRKQRRNQSPRGRLTAARLPPRSQAVGQQGRQPRPPDLILRLPHIVRQPVEDQKALFRVV